MVVSIWTPGLIAVVHSIPVVMPGSKPKRGDAEIFEIGKAIDDAAQIAAVIRRGDSFYRWRRAERLEECCWIDRRQRTDPA